MLLPYRVKVSDTKVPVTHFTPILALCTCLYRLHLWKPVSMKQTKHSRKSEAQNLCSKCPPFTRTHAFKQLRHCAIADGFGDSVQSWCYTAALLGTRVKVNGEYYRNTVLLNMLMLDMCSVFWNYYVFSKMVHQHIVHVIRALSPCCRERRQSLSLQRCGHLIRQI